MTFPKMVDYLAPGEKGEARLDIFSVSKKDSRFTAIRQASNPGRMEFVPEGKYMRLFVGGQLVMSDTNMERDTNQEFLWRAHGHVLLGGLGLGMVVLAAQDKSEVKSITVLELSQDVIDLVVPQLPLSKKVTVVTADVFQQFILANEPQFDTIYMDIWPNICSDNFAAMLELREKYSRCLNPNGWFGCWSWGIVAMPQEGEIKCAYCDGIFPESESEESDEGEPCCMECYDAGEGSFDEEECG